MFLKKRKSSRTRMMAILWKHHSQQIRIAPDCPIKPFADREQIYRRIRHAEEQNLLAVGIDIDHPYANDGSPDVVDGHEMKALNCGELEELCKSTRLPLITKGVLSLKNA
jgi:hypothetical protein